MGLNWGDVALNLTAGAIEKSEVKRKEDLEQRFKELQDNKEIYRALATTRYSKDLDKYYKEAEKYENLQDVYTQIQSANGGKGMDKTLAAKKIIFSDPELFAEWTAYGTTKSGLSARLAMVSQVESGFKDRTIDGKVVGYEFSHPGLELTSPKQEEYFQSPNYWGDLAKEIQSNTKGPLQKQILKLLGKEPAEVDLDTLAQKAGTDIKQSISNQIYTSSNMDKGTSLITGGSGIIKSSFDTDGLNEKVFTTATADKKNWINKANTNQEMYSVLAQMGDSWIEDYLVEEAWQSGEVRFKAGGEGMAQQVRALWRDVVQFHYNETFYEGGIFPGSDREVIDNFNFQEIMNTFRNEYERRNIEIVNDPDKWMFPDELFEKIPFVKDKDFRISYVIDSTLLPYYEKTVIDGKETYAKPDVDREGLQEYINGKIIEYTSEGQQELKDVKELESYIRAEIKNNYENVAPKKLKEKQTEFVEIEVTEDMVQSQMKEFDKTREEVIEDFQENPIKENRKFILPEDFDLTGEATLEDIRQQEEELNKANKLPFRVDGPLTWQDWKDATAKEVYDAYITEPMI